jgi:7,8-dihydropterin-6-yl-methyl-4-(beta-D-ribofuranosyl)aminobenzene 5'-phosphate synthase
VVIRIKTLCENTASLNCISEWGLSILTDVDGFKILSDTGGGLSIIHNAKAMGVDFSDIDKVVISHGHWDHAGGLPEVLQGRADAIDVIGHPDIWSSKYSYKEGSKEQYIGIQYNREYLESLGARFKLSSEPVWITDNIVTTGEVSMITEYESIDENLLVKNESGFQPDPLADDTSIGIKTDDGLVIILGCSHRGMINNIRQLQKITKEDRVSVVIGGTHLMAASDERISKTIEDLRKLDIKKLGVSHCTGFKACTQLYKHFPDTFFNNNAGSEISLP